MSETRTGADNSGPDEVDGSANDHGAGADPTVSASGAAGRDGSTPGLPAAARRVALAVTGKLDSLTRSVVNAHGERWPILARTYDAWVLRGRMQRSLGYRPNLRRPTTYNEKLAWRILHGDDPLIALTTDKIAVRDYVAEKVGPELLIPLVGVYDRAVDIRWDELPTSFVLKASHGCAMNLIVPDKDAVDRSEVLRTAERWMQTNYYEESRERAYRNIPPRLLIEEFLSDDDGGVPADYKFLVFHGRTALIRVHTGRFGDHRVTFFDPDLRPVEMAQVYPSDPGVVLPPEVRDMVPVAEKLAEDFDYARIDLYLARGRAWFGEITHHDGNAHVFFNPPEVDAALGKLWNLPPRAAGVKRFLPSRWRS
jgi:hypothetical protein